jgi:hypothetical protein
VAQAEALEGGQVAELGGDGQLEVVAGDGLVEGDRGRVVAVALAQVVGVDEVGPRSTAVGRGGEGNRSGQLTAYSKQPKAMKLSNFTVWRRRVPMRLVRCKL